MPIPAGIARRLVRSGLAQRLPSVRRVMGAGLPYLKHFGRRVLASPNEELQHTRALLGGVRPGVLDLSLGTPRFPTTVPPPDPAADYAGYPPLTGCPRLRAAIADRLRDRNGLSVDPEHGVLVLNGVSQAIGLALDTFADAGDRIALFDPGYFMVRLAVLHREMKPVRIPTTLHDGRTAFDERDLRRAIRRSRMVFVNTPANPTGGVLPPETLERIAYWCRRYDTLIFSDEVYQRFHYVGRHVSIATLPDAAGRTLTADSFSKSHALAGLRLGFAAGPEHLLKPLHVTLLATTPFVSMAAQDFGRRLLESADDRFPAAEFARRRLDVLRRLRRGGSAVEAPGGAFYFWLPLPEGVHADDFAAALLEDEQVLVLPGTHSARDGHRHIRLSFAGDAGELAEGIGRLLRHLGMSLPLPLPLPLPLRRSA